MHERRKHESEESRIAILSGLFRVFVFRAFVMEFSEGRLHYVNAPTTCIDTYGCFSRAWAA
jgi:hypothetical protein